MKVYDKLNNKGLSLIEVMVSMIILSIGVLGIAPMLIVSMESSGISKSYTVAANLAKDKIESIAGLDSMYAVPYSEEEVNLEGKYTRITSVNDKNTDATIADGVYQIDVQVQWADDVGRQNLTTFSTLLAKSGA